MSPRGGVAVTHPRAPPCSLAPALPARRAMATPRVPAPDPALLLLLCVLAACHARPEPVPGDVTWGCGAGEESRGAWPSVGGISAHSHAPVHGGEPRSAHTQTAPRNKQVYFGLKFKTFGSSEPRLRRLRQATAATSTSRTRWTSRIPRRSRVAASTPRSRRTRPPPGTLTEAEACIRRRGRARSHAHSPDRSHALIPVIWTDSEEAQASADTGIPTAEVAPRSTEAGRAAPWPPLCPPWFPPLFSPSWARPSATSGPAAGAGPACGAASRQPRFDADDDVMMTSGSHAPVAGRQQCHQDGAGLSSVRGMELPCVRDFREDVAPE
ncbi:uncharacterized protein LOC127676124 [Apodemus sylvaticus]|uniref:uncharacterized protein LOC127676124 n=1 Tax=Apodemus sylvaticus TaxID=10129 RepID=UPI0022424E71|nr:uncharacterized protein LOC127676124 [Apodemus sylvaticus]